MNKFRLTLSSILGVLALASSPVAKAQGTASDKASAEALFDDGASLMKAGNYSEACSKFEASQALEATLGTELRLADCYEQLGRTASAWALFKESEGLAHRQNESDREEVARVRVAALARKLSYLVIDTTGDPPPGLVIERNGQRVPLASLGLPIPVDPGMQAVSARAPSRELWSTNIDVPNAPGTVNLSVPELAVIAPRREIFAPRRREVSSSGSTQRALGIGASAVGFAGILAGAGLGFYAKHENDLSRGDQYCPTDGHNGCTEAGLNLRQRSQAFANASTVTLLASGAVLAGGVILWSTAPRHDEQTARREIHVGASGGPDSFQTLLGGTW
ncbi:MAG TPA: hypothetical protein VHV51_12750 [Polyangiaceae bacterium]|jgi:tetratricopeptide (TPR) repeat protein|nr:hypothetical protein [Polyangiaceae bacterium]